MAFSYKKKNTSTYNNQGQSGNSGVGAVYEKTGSGSSKTSHGSGKTTTSGSNQSASSGSNKPLTAASALKNYNNVQSQKPSSFTYNDTQLKKLYDEAMNRKDFSFDLNGNAFYNQYKDKFTKQGQLAMADTVGQVAAASGGYGNSYAQTAGQQIYQQNLDQLTDIVPDLYNLAFQQYQYEGQQLQDKYAMATGERDFAYGKYRDDVSDWQYNNDTAYNIYADTRNYEYQQQRDKVADDQWQQSFGENQRLWQQSYGENQRQFDLNFGLEQDKFNETKNQNAIQNQQWQQSFDRSNFESDRAFTEGQRQFDASLAFDQQQAATANAQWDKSFGLSQQQLEETIRHNQANEGYNMQSLMFDSSNPFGESTGSSGGTEDVNLKNVKATKSYDELSGKAKEINNLFMHKTQDQRIAMVYNAIEKDQISAEDAVYLFKACGYSDY